MARGWFGLGILIVFLILGIGVTAAMNSAHNSTEALLVEAAEQTLNGSFDRAVTLGLEAKTQWEDHWNGTATVADHSPMDEVDALFAEMEIYAKAEEKPHFAAVCRELSRRISSFADAHRFSLWNIL